MSTDVPVPTLHPPPPPPAEPFGPPPDPVAHTSTHPSVAPPTTAIGRAWQAFRAFLRKHHRKLWWLHSAYALTLGMFVVMFAQRGFGRARYLAATLLAAWIGLLFFFRLFGSGTRAQTYATAVPGAKTKFLLVTYLLKNLYQGMLFFLLPFYWKATSFDSSNRFYIIALAACAGLSTLDVVFDRVLMRWRLLASMFYGFTLFSALNLVIPALFPNTRSLVALMIAGGVTVLAFTLLHVPLRSLANPRVAASVAAALAAGITCAYTFRAMVPPVPMHVRLGAVGPQVLPDGRLAMEVSVLHHSVIQQLMAVTDVVTPGGKGDRLRHVWRHEGREVMRAAEQTARVDGPEGTVRLRSNLAGRSLPSDLVGRWTVDVETEDGQLVGRTRFTVTR